MALLLASLGAAAGQDVRALLIGNNYKQPQYAGPLRNAVNDAQSMRDLLVGRLGVAGAAVAHERDATRQKIREAWDQMLQGLSEGVALFYFSGHGIEVDGRNYLIPDQAPEPRSNKMRDLVDAFVSFDEILDALRERQKGHPKIIGILILDACRENPFGGNTKSLVVSKGLAPVQLPQNSETFVMYAAGAGQLALDSLRTAPGANSLYTRYLLEELSDAGRANALSLSDLAQNIREKVVKAARSDDHAQVPSYYDQLVTRRTLLGKPAERLTFSEEQERLPVVRPVAAAAQKSAPVPGSEPVPLPPDCDGCPSLVAVPAGVLGGTPVRALAFGKTEVTNREWNTCVKNGRCTGYRGFPWVAAIQGAYRENKPAADVSWADAAAYVAWLSEITKQAYRLPTEAEWEYAARAGASLRARYAFGDNDAELCQYANGADQSLKALVLETAPCNDRFARETAPVASFRANAFGLHDMHGNVWEWVDGCWTASPGSVAAQGPAGCTRIARGGSWRSAPANLRAAARASFAEGHRRSTLGFRVVRELAP